MHTNTTENLGWKSSRDRWPKRKFHVESGVRDFHSLFSPGVFLSSQSQAMTRLSTTENV